MRGDERVGKWWEGRRMGEIEVEVRLVGWLVYATLVFVRDNQQIPLGRYAISVILRSSSKEERAEGAGPSSSALRELGSLVLGELEI